MSELGKTYTYEVEFIIDFVRYKEIVQTITAAEARKFIKMKYPSANVVGAREIK